MFRNFCQTAILILVLILLLTPSSVHSVAARTDFNAVDAYVEGFMRENRVPGIALAIVEGDQIVYARGYGAADPSGRPVTAQTPFIIGSTGKSITALAVMQLVDAGKIDLDAPVRQYLPWFDLGGGAITVRHLLNHTSGIPQKAGQDTQSSNDSDAGALERQVRGLNGWNLAHAPGFTYEYANANYQTAGLVVQVVSGEPFESYIQRFIYDPLDMRRSYTSKNEALKNGLAGGYHYWFGLPVPAGFTPYPRQQFPSGYFISTAEDMAHTLIAHLNAGSYAGRRLLSAQGIEILHRPALANYAMGWVEEKGILSHNGSVPEHGSQILIDTRRQLGVVILFNINNAIGADHLYILAPNVLNVLTDSFIMPTPSKSGYQTYLVLLPVLLSAEIAWLVWSFTRLKRWQKQPAVRPHGIRALVHLAIPVLCEFGLAIYLWMLLTESVWNALLYQPDLTLLILVISGLLMIWGSIRTLVGARLVLR